MAKHKFTWIYVVLLFLPLLFRLIDPVKADRNSWSVNWLNHINYYDSPFNISTTTEVSSADDHCTTIT